MKDTWLTRVQILLLVYVIYLFFQLKSHAYMYQSMPQHVIDEEATPGPVTAWLETSSSDDSSSSDSDSSGSSHSRGTVTKRMKRAIRGGRRRKSSFASQDAADVVGPPRTPSFGTANTASPHEDAAADDLVRTPVRGNTGDVHEEAGEDDRGQRRKPRRHRHSIRRHRKHKKKSRSGLSSSDMIASEATIDEDPETAEKQAVPNRDGETRRVDFALGASVASHAEGQDDSSAARRPFTLRNVSFRPVAKSLAPTVFTQPADPSALPPAPTGPIPRVRYGIRRTNSLPDRLNEYRFRQPGAMLPSQISMAALVNAPLAAEEAKAEGHLLSRRASVFLLIVTTGLVAACADFMVESINGLVETNNIGEIFIGLIILPIVGNAAEHVTAVVVAMKNKMDLAIGVAVGSSIQVALFITPLMVILGWIIGRDMTLYFSLFETVCLFVSAFIVNFLVLDGRSNYLEGALLCATYIIIGVVAFYYPAENQTSQYGQ